MRVDTISGQPVIEVDRFCLRPLRPSDAGVLQLYAADRRVAEATSSIPHPYPPGAAEAFIAQAIRASQAASQDPGPGERRGIVWAMDGSGRNLGELLGVIALKCMDRSQAEIGYWVAPAFWNTGIASAAVQALVETNPLNCKAYFAQVFQDNPASARVLTKAGFEYIGDAETFSVARDTIVPTWTYIRKLA